MHMSPEEKQGTLRRLRSIEGHVRGIARMIDEDSYCIEVIQQIRAVQAALDKVAAHALKDHLDHCVVSAMQSQDEAERSRVVDEMLTVFQTQGR